MTNDTENVIPLNQSQNKMSKYDLLKNLMSNKEKVKAENTSLRWKICLGIIALLLAIGLYFRSQLGHRPASIEESLTQEQCPVVGNVDSKLYHLPKDSHYLELLQGNKARENRICFRKEWEAWLVGYKKSKL